MLTSVLILLTGLLLVYLEFFLPGGVMGALGGILMLLSVIVFAGESSTFLPVVGFFLAAAVGLALVVRLAIWRIRAASPERSVYLASDQKGYVASSFDEGAIGQEGEVLSDLKPSGFVFVDGRKQQAISQTGYIKSGCHVVVIGGRGSYLIVKPVTKEVGV
ncbi:MAG: serine protease [Chlamydiia bacterium]|nr:serine protease [Chlamydiia bacterium]